MDEDLETLSPEQLAGEVLRLRQGIRQHRDERGDDRCWLDDQRLYSLLPDKKAAITTLPPKDVFLKSCERFWKTRQASPQKLHEW
ncbi:MAG TPA: hypothetical protein VFT43_07995 [Candidatus Polarisedimenticolia bacterium]|nr:hypothetical protein [Candidatus Polarisedimenticolia bacterium]